MKNKTPKIPKGWRVIRKGTIIKPGDKWCGCLKVWRKTDSVGCTVGGPGSASIGFWAVYIRKNTGR